MNEATLPPEEARMWLRLGLRAVRAGDRTEARRYFQWAREAEPDNVVALLWLAGLIDDPDLSEALLTRALELDPHNQHALAGIRALRPPVGVVDPVDSVAVEATPPGETADVPTYRKVGQPEVAPATARPQRMLGWLLALMVAALVLVFVGWLAIGQLRSLVTPLLVPIETAVPVRSTDPTPIPPLDVDTSVSTQESQDAPTLAPASGAAATASPGDVHGTPAPSEIPGE